MDIKIGNDDNEYFDEITTYKRAIKLMRYEKYNMAVHEFEKLHSNFPENLNYEYNLCVAYYYNDNYDEAKKGFIKLFDTNNIQYMAESASYLGFICEESNEIIEAEQWHNKALELDNSNASYSNILANFYFNNDQFSDAIPYYLNAIKLSNHKDPTYFDNLGYLYFSTHDYKNALNYFSIAHQLDPTSPSYNYNIGNTYYHLHDDIHAYEYILQTAILSEGESKYVYKLAQVCCSLGKFQEALHYFTDAATSSPLKAEYQNALGNAYMFHNDYENAEKYLKKAVDIEPENLKYNDHYNHLLLNISKNAGAL